MLKKEAAPNKEPGLMLEGIEVVIKREEVLRYLGYRRKEARGEVAEILAKEIEEGYSLITPKAVYSRQTVKNHKGGVMALQSGLSLNIGSASRKWQNAEYLGIALCTIGTPLEDRVDELFAEEDPVSALVLDSVGSVAVEAVADEINYIICSREKETGNKVGPRSSPGYGKWGLTDQKVLFSLLPADRINVQLNQQCMMIPRKSCSFCIGMGKGLDCRFNPCRRCGKENCHYRGSQK